MSIDYMPYFVSLEKSDLAHFKRESRRSLEPWARNRPSKILAAVAVVLVLGYYGIFGAYFLPGRSWDTFDLLVIVVLAAMAITAFAGSRGQKSAWERIYRRVSFARANSLDYLHEARVFGYPGMIFRGGRDRMGEARFRREEPYLDFGGFRRVTGTEKQPRIERWGFAAMRLPRRVPHMLLDAKANNLSLNGTRLPESFHRSQVLSLEGDFDRHFTLYCPRQYERDALYVFTPDLMALLIDESSAYDVEIVDDWLFLYSPTGISIDDPATVKRMFRIADTVGRKAERQTERYADERIGDREINLVAPQGRRLRRHSLRVPLSVLATIVVVCVVFFRIVI